ncbi:MAG: isoprenylcysteine carboxylmethyltransferase family protein [Anaerolineae bacterium]|nr:isoprenylcysteine carboxylmethyltransferase family protein [Anaerolineae bacterium]
MKADSAHRSNAAHKSRWEIGEVVFGIPFLIGIALHLLLPFSLPQGVLRQVLIPVGIVLISIGMGFIVLARRAFARFRQPTDPGQPTSQVIKTGVFAISRNPLYLGAAFLFCGVALMMNTLWTLTALLVSLIVCHYVLIVPEENYLAAKFGEEYKAYTATVRRWLGRK